MRIDAQEKKPGIREILSKIYYFILLCIVSALLISQSGGGPRVIAGFGVFNVLTGSMESVIPQGSLVITKRVEPTSIVIGDDITFMNGPSTTITHRVIEIIEDVDEVMGNRAFVTKGTENATPDKNPVRQENVVGKVIWHNLALGKVMEFFQTYWIALIVYLLFFSAVYKLMIRFLERRQEEKSPEQLQEDFQNETHPPSQMQQAQYEYQQQSQIQQAQYEYYQQLYYQQYIYQQQLQYTQPQQIQQPVQQKVNYQEPEQETKGGEW